jgi:hypothetical protein
MNIFYSFWAEDDTGRFSAMVIVNLERQNEFDKNSKAILAHGLGQEECNLWEENKEYNTDQHSHPKW